MLNQLLVGGLVGGLSIAIHVVFIVSAIAVLRRSRSLIPHMLLPFKVLIRLVAVTMWLLAGLTVCVFVWAALFSILGLFETFEASTYFAIVAFTTLGFGDVLLPEDWRLLAGICAAVGLMLFGLSTAFLFEVFSRILRATGRFD